jgi:CubicO group peptidase (beta-lactamase class C family)
MMTRWATCILAAVFALVAPAWGQPVDPLPRARPESVGVSSQKLAEIAVALNREIDNKTMPGAVVAIARKGKLVYYEAFGRLDDRSATRMPKNAIFEINSMTKPLTTVGALELFEQGRLMLNEPAATYLPQLDSMAVATSTGTEPAVRKPTIQDMLRHTAGVTYGSAEGIIGTTELSRQYGQLMDRKLTADQFLAKLGSLPLQYQPGTKWAYSLGLDVTGLAQEAVTKERLGAYLQISVFAPLGMADTSFVVPASKASRMAGPVTWDPMVQAGYDSGGAGAYSTAADYLRFAEMLRRGGSLGTVHLLGRKTVEYMTSDQLGPEVDLTALRNYPNLNGYGFGLSVAVRRGQGVSGMVGSPGDFNWGGAGGTFFWVDPKEELTVVLMERTSHDARIHMRQVITTLVYAALTN